MAIDHLPAMTIFRKAKSSLEETRNLISLAINAQGHTVKLIDIHPQLSYVRIVYVINLSSAVIWNFLETPLKVPLCLQCKVEIFYIFIVRKVLLAIVYSLQLT